MEEANILENEGPGAPSKIALSPLIQSVSASFPNNFWNSGIAELGNQGIGFAVTAKQIGIAPVSNYLDS